MNRAITKQSLCAWGVVMAVVTGTAVIACGDRFTPCQETRTCPSSAAGGGGAGGDETPNDSSNAGLDAGGGSSAPGGSAGATTGGAPVSEPGGGAPGASGMAAEEPMPPSGAFAWYKASSEDVSSAMGALADGNEFIKSGWVKQGLTAEALQPGVDGENDATALFDSPSTSVAVRKISHVVTSESSYAPMKVRLRAKMGERRYLWLSSGIAFTSFDLLDGVVARIGHVAKMTALPNLWYECEISTAGPSLSIGVSSTPDLAYQAPNTTKPAVWIQHAELEQSYVTRWQDRAGTNDFLDLVGAWTFIASEPGLNGLPALNAQYTDRVSLQAGSAADWSFLHDGSGSTVVTLQYVSKYASVANLGNELNGDSQGLRLGVSLVESARVGFGVTNAQGADVFALLGGSLADDAPHWTAGVFDMSARPNARLYYDGELVDSADAAASPSAQPSLQALRVGDATDRPNNQTLHEILIFKRALDSNEMTQLGNYFKHQLRH